MDIQKQGDSITWAKEAREATEYLNKILARMPQDDSLVVEVSAAQERVPEPVVKEATGGSRASLQPV
jgi:hypothetical protein